MRKIIAFLCAVMTNFACMGQCSTVSVQIASSDTTHIKLYQAGFFLIPSGFANTCEWEVTSFSGEILFQATTSGGFNDQPFVTFDQPAPISDSMKVTLVISNPMEGITCTMNDTL